MLRWEFTLHKMMSTTGEIVSRIKLVHVVGRSLSFARNGTNVKTKTIVSATSPNNDDTVLVKWGDGATEEFLNAWLRDNCPCHQCYHPQSQVDLHRWLRW